MPLFVAEGKGYIESDKEEKVIMVALLCKWFGHRWKESYSVLVGPKRRCKTCGLLQVQVSSLDGPVWRSRPSA